MKDRLNLKQRFLLESEAKKIKNGVQGEKDAAYYIDFYFAKSKKWAVIHDLRLEHENQSAQIDHILINRFFDFFVLESKNYSHGVKITPSGEFETFNGKWSLGIESPVEQNKRHIHFLKGFLKSKDILPRRMGIPIKPKYYNLILIAPKCIISRPAGKDFDTSSIIKAETLRTKIDEMVDKHSVVSDLASLGKLSSFETVEEFAKKLASFHHPIKFDFRAKFGLHKDDPGNQELAKFPPNTENRPQSPSKYFCAACKKPIPSDVAKLCWENKSKFGGKAYCIDCQ